MFWRSTMSVRAHKRTLSRALCRSGDAKRMSDEMRCNRCHHLWLTWKWFSSRTSSASRANKKTIALDLGAHQNYDKLFLLINFERYSAFSRGSSLPLHDSGTIWLSNSVSLCNDAFRKCESVELPPKHWSKFWQSDLSCCLCCLQILQSKVFLELEHIVFA